MGDKVRQFFDQLKRDIAAQKKKAAGLGFLVLVLLIVVVRLLLPGKSTQEVAAAPNLPVKPAPAVVEPTAHATAGNRPQSVRASAAGDLQQADFNSMEPRERNLSGLPRTLARDPFRNPSWLRPLRKDDEVAESPQESWLTRLSEQWSDYQAKADAVEQLVDQKLAELQLQSTMIGPISSAYISGRLVHEGDELAGFSVVKIETRRVTLSFSGVTRSLTSP